MSKLCFLFSFFRRIDFLRDIVIIRILIVFLSVYPPKRRTATFTKCRNFPIANFLINSPNHRENEKSRICTLYELMVEEPSLQQRIKESLRGEWYEGSFTIILQNVIIFVKNKERILEQIIVIVKNVQYKNDWRSHNTCNRKLSFVHRCIVARMLLNSINSFYSQRRKYAQPSLIYMGSHLGDCCCKSLLGLLP